MTDALWDSSSLDKPNFFKYNVHLPFQGMTREKTKKISQKLSLPMRLCLLNFNGNSNIGMSIRTAAVMGASDVYVIGYRQYDKRSTVGAQNYVNVNRLAWTDDPVGFFESEGCCPILIEQGGTPLEDFVFAPYLDKPIVFIMGSEGNGVDKTWLGKLKGVPRVTISQYGMVRSITALIFVAWGAEMQARQTLFVYWERKPAVLCCLLTH
jgi:tRNA G18 (ribose-2'-O)-methylase SpoU